MGIGRPPRPLPFEETSEPKFDVFSSPINIRREAEKRTKFEALQAASRSLENKLLMSGREETGHQKLQEIEKRFQACTSNKIDDSTHHTIGSINREHCLENKRYPERIVNPFEHQQQQARSKYDADMERARNMLQNNQKKETKSERLAEKLVDKLPKATQTNLPPPLNTMCQSPVPKPISVRQDSNVSSDSFSQTSSPSYTSKTMEAPLLPHKHINGKVPGKSCRTHIHASRSFFILIFIKLSPSSCKYHIPREIPINQVESSSRDIQCSKKNATCTIIGVLWNSKFILWLFRQKSMKKMFGNFTRNPIDRKGSCTRNGQPTGQPNYKVNEYTGQSSDDREVSEWQQHVVTAQGELYRTMWWFWDIRHWGGKTIWAN